MLIFHGKREFFFKYKFFGLDKHTREYVFVHSRLNPICEQKMKRTKEEAEITRCNILDAALKVFTAKGYRATRLEDIAVEACVTKGAIYWHFKNKYDLFHQLMIENTPDPMDLSKIKDSQFSAEEKIRQVIVYFLQGKGFRGRHEDFFGLVQIVDGNREELSELHEYVNNNRNSGISTISRIIEDGKKTGELSPDLDSNVAGHAIFSYGSGFLMLQATGSNFNIAENAEKIMSIIMKGLF